MSVEFDDGTSEPALSDKNRKLDADLKGKLDFFLWHQRFKGHYQAWSRAKTPDKPALLLVGQPLTTAEGWLLLHPSKFSDGERRFITRSMAQLTQAVVSTQAESGRVGQTGRRSSATIPLIAAAMVVAAIALPRVLVQPPKPVAGKQAPEVASAGAVGNAGNRTNAVRPVEGSSDDRESTAEQPAVEPSTEATAASDGPVPLPARETQTADANGSVSETRHGQVGHTNPRPARSNPWNSARHKLAEPDKSRPRLAAEHIRKLATLADQFGAAGNIGQAQQIAFEALRRAAAMPAGPDRDGGILAAASAAHRGLAIRTKLDVAAAETRAAPSILFCEATDAFVMASRERQIAAWRAGHKAAGEIAASRPGSPTSASAGSLIAGQSRLLEGAAADGSCARIALPRDDDSVEIYALGTGRRLARFDGHEADPTVVAMSTDGATVASGSLDKTVRIFDAATGRAKATIDSHDGTITALAFDRGGQRIASGSNDRTVRVFEAATGREIAAFGGYNEPVRGVAFDAEARRVLAFGDGSVRIHPIAGDGKTVALTAPGRALLSAQFSPDGTRALAIADDGTAVVFDAASGRPVFELARPAGDVRAAAWSADGQHLLSLGWPGDVTLHDPDTGHAYAVVAGQDAPAIAARFSRDGTHLVAVLETGVVVTTPVSVSLDRAAKLLRAAAGCMPEAEVRKLGAGPPAGDCDIALPEQNAARPWLMSAAPRQPKAPEASLEVDISGLAIASGGRE